jgi:hypothetical protein
MNADEPASVVEILLKFIEIINNDFKEFLENGHEEQQNNNFIIYPDETTQYCQEAGEFYIF